MQVKKDIKGKYLHLQFFLPQFHPFPSTFLLYTLPRFFLPFSPSDLAPPSPTNPSSSTNQQPPPPATNPSLLYQPTSPSPVHNP
ncbi:hypothetical protein Pcinc_009937 [Petrolisthes cinctipes]|uniref:Uncharacterized protein n=1 Tax=Petrolisthes cinctipes TaxID=88211 RepID=A0AAE1KU78_PETCI|nr:hypothetical protein Pcinc_009937 [Petrolisthes cinctipes]